MPEPAPFEASPGLVRVIDNAQVVWDDVPVASSGGVLSIDIEGAREIVARLQGVADRVWEVQRALRLMLVTPPARDEVSQNAADQTFRMTIAATSYLKSWREQLLNGATGLAGQIDSYEMVESTNSAKM